MIVHARSADVVSAGYFALVTWERGRDCVTSLRSCKGCIRCGLY